MAFYTVEDRRAMAEIRKFHNHIKLCLLRAAFARTGGDRLLDLGSGRGGDVHKWEAVGAAHVTAVDVDAAGLRELEKRASGKRFTLRCIQQTLWDPAPRPPYDVVAAMFSLHFAAGALDSLATNLALAMHDHSVLIVTCVNGEVLAQRLTAGSLSLRDGSGEFCNYESRPGSRVAVRLSSISRDVHVEPLLAPGALVAACARHGLLLMQRSEAQGLGLPAPTGSFAMFGGDRLGEDQKTFSHLNQFFVFVRCALR